MLTGKRFLDSARFNRIIATLQSKLDIARPLRFLTRTPLVEAYDDELVGRFTGNVFAADIIADDQEAVTYEAGKLEIVTHAIPNLKLGAHIPQSHLNRMSSMEARGSTVQEENALSAFENRRAENLLLGVRQRANALCAAMWLDEGQYDRWGIMINGSFGTPAAYKSTVQTLWSSTSALPISNVLAMNTFAVNDSGQMYNRITMSTQALQYAVATTEFKQLAAALLPTAVGTTGVNIGNLPLMEDYLGMILKMKVEIEDATYKERAANGKVITKRVMPANKVILSNSDSDNDPNVMDLANGIPTERIVAGLVGNAPEGLSGEAFGPVGYYTARANLDPPDITAYAVWRCMPRKHVPEATAVLTVF